MENCGLESRVAEELAPQPPRRSEPLSICFDGDRLPFIIQQSLRLS